MSQAHFSTCIVRVDAEGVGHVTSTAFEGCGRRWPQDIMALCAGVIAARSSMLMPVGFAPGERQMVAPIVGRDHLALAVETGGKAVEGSRVQPGLK